MINNIINTDNMKITCKNLCGLFLFSMMVLTYSCTSTIKWDKVNVDPLTNAVTFKKNNEKVSGTVAKGEKKGLYEEIVVEDGTIVYEKKYKYGKLILQVDYRIRQTTNYNDDGTVGSVVYKTVGNQDSLQIHYYANGNPRLKVDNAKRESTRYYTNGGPEETVFKTIDNQDSVKINYDEKGVITQYATFNQKTLQDTIKYLADDGTLSSIKIYKDKNPVYTAIYFKGGKIPSSETIWGKDGKSVKKKYNSQRQLLESTTYTANDIPLKSYEYTNGKQTKVTVFDDKGNVYSVNGQRIFPVMEGVQLIAYKTGFYHLYDFDRYLWVPIVMMKWKNVSGVTIEESIELVGTFLEGEEEFNEKSVYLHSKYSDNPMTSGLVRQEALISGTGYTSVSALPHVNIKCNIYVNKKLYTTFKISSQQLYSNRF